MSAQKTRLVRIRGIHAYSFRTGVWAQVLGTVWLTPEYDLEGRPCFVVMYPDGVVDYIPIEDERHYQIAPEVHSEQP